MLYPIIALASWAATGATVIGAVSYVYQMEQYYENESKDWQCKPKIKYICPAEPVSKMVIKTYEQELCVDLNGETQVSKEVERTQIRYD
jgi:hypothetical protein